MQSNEDQPIQVANDQADLIDLFVPIVENIKLLVLGPLFVGLCALGISYFLPKTYVSTAIVNTPTTIQPNPAEHVAASLMTSAIVLDPVIASLKLKEPDEPIEIARENLRSDVKAIAGRNDKLVTLTVMANTPDKAQAIANAILKQTFIESRLKKPDLERITAQLEAARTTEKKALAAAAIMAQRLEATPTPSSAGNEIGRGYADLLNSASQAQSKVAGIEERLQTLSETNLLQAPTLPQKATKPVKALIAVAATFGAFVLLLLLVMLRQHLNHVAVDPSANAKLNTIRLALGLTAKK
jgi:uncharacterized protein involved in exopolysaccharide biosynthesis